MGTLYVNMTRKNYNYNSGCLPARKVIRRGVGKILAVLGVGRETFRGTLCENFLKSLSESNSYSVRQIGRYIHTYIE